MKNKSIILLCIFFFTVCLNHACESGKKEENQLSALETAQQFIRLEMSGEFKNASNYLLSSDNNRMILSVHQTEYETLSKEMRKQLKFDIINIGSYQETSDSSAVLTYSNTIDTSSRQLQLIRQKNKWLVDFIKSE